MELLLQAIEEKLLQVDIERNKWLQYKEEHVHADNNLREFQLSFQKNVMVPIGSKALMPGQLYHTNEIFVGMYGGLFIKCSADKALAVCHHRLDEANKRIEGLNAEYQMYRDRLELPADENAFDNGNEIIEEYNEEEEMEWREQHKIRVRQQKIAEAEERKRQQMESDIDIDEILERAALMEELDEDLERLNINDDEQLKKHLDGKSETSIDIDLERDDVEMKDNENDSDDQDGDGSKEYLAIKEQAIGLSIKDKINFYEVHMQKLKDYFSTTQCTIHNFDEFAEKRVTEENVQNAIEELRETLDAETESKTDKNDQPVQQDKDKLDVERCGNLEPKKHLSRADYDQVERDYSAQNKSKLELLVFYKSQKRIITKSIAGCSLDEKSKNEKRELYEFVDDRLSKLRIEMQLEKQIQDEEDFVDDEDIDQNAQQRSSDPNDSGFDMDDCKDDDPTGKRKISFASEPLTVTFRDDDEPYVVSQLTQENLETLMDTEFQEFDSPGDSSNSSICGDDEDNKARENEHPMNSTNDCDTNFTMKQINESTMNKVEDWARDAANTTNNANSQLPSTLVLKFCHSSTPSTAVVSDDDTINSPLDIYKQFGVPAVRPTNPLIQALEVPNIDAKPQKSILKNSILVKNEIRAPIASDDIKGPSLSTNDQRANDDLPGFTQVLGDVVERENIVESNTLPDDNQSGSENHPTGDKQSGGEQKVEKKPKKYMSLFKKSRK